MTRFGVGGPLPVANAATHAKSIRNTGCVEVRLPIYWDQVEPNQGSYNWAPFDQQVKVIRAAGLGFLPIAYFSPPWHRPNRKLAPDPAVYAGFVVELLAHFGCPAVECFNEPNWRISKDEPLDWDGTPAQFAACYRAARAASHIRFGNGRSVVVGGLSFATGWPGEPTGSGVDYLRGIWDELGPVDAVGYHPYGFGSDPAGAAMVELKKLTDFLTKRKSAALVDVTEIGLPVGLPGLNYSEKDRSGFFKKLATKVQEMKRVRRFCAYTWRTDHDPWNIANQDGSWKGGASGYSRGIKG